MNSCAPRGCRTRGEDPNGVRPCFAHAVSECASIVLLTRVGERHDRHSIALILSACDAGRETELAAALAVDDGTTRLRPAQ